MKWQLFKVWINGDFIHRAKWGESLSFLIVWFKGGDRRLEGIRVLQGSIFKFKWTSGHSSDGICPYMDFKNIPPTPTDSDRMQLSKH